MDGTVQRIEVTAPQQLVYETALDLETYPTWAGGVKSVTIVEDDEYGRPTVAEFTIDAMIKEISYTLDYDHDRENGFGWVARPNEDLTLLEGIEVGDRVRFTFEPRTGGQHVLMSIEKLPTS